MNLKMKDCKALFYIQQGDYGSNFEKISKITKEKEVRDILNKYHEGDEKVKKIKFQSLSRKFELMEIEEYQKIIDNSKLIDINL